MHRLLSVGCLTATLAASSFAQTPPAAAELPSEKPVEGWLRSGEPRLVAWGAHDTLLAGNRNLLALRPVPGFAADLLANLKVEATVIATTPGSEQYGGGRCDDHCAASFEIPRKRWPITGQYSLSRQQRDGAVLLVAGVDPVYATREQSTFYTGDACGMSMYMYLGFRRTSPMDRRNAEYSSRTVSLEHHSPDEYSVSIAPAVLR